MTPEEAPVGTIVVFPNGYTAKKVADGRFLYHSNDFGAEVDYDDLHKAARLIYNPEDPR